MGIQGPFQVDTNRQFPFGVAVAGPVAPARDFEHSTREKFVQALDRETGLPLWEVDVIDFDPEARERSFKVRIASAVQPVPPEAVGDSPIRPVYFENLEISMYPKAMPNGRASIVFSVRATGMSAPKPRVQRDAGAARDGKAA